MQDIKITIKDLFDLVSKKENHIFEINKEYYQKTKLQILNSKREFCNIIFMIIKYDDVIEFTLNDDSILRVGSKHIIVNDSFQNVIANSLNIGDYLFNINGSKLIKNIKYLKSQYVYDISVDEKDHLYYDSFGFLHHNSHTVTTLLSKELGSEGKKWIQVKGKTSTLGLYGALFVNRNKLIIFDDCDSVFNNEDSINILKAALDSHERRMVSWISPATVNVSKMDDEQKEDLFISIESALETGDTKNIKFPDKFEFTGKIIFISNLPESKVDDAIKSRSFVIDMTLDRDGMLTRMTQILPHLCKDSSMEDKQEVLDLLVQDGDKLNMRTFVGAVRIRESGNPRWADLVRRYA